MSLIGKSLDAASSAPTTGAVLTFDVPKSNVSMQVVTTGSPSSFAVSFKVSLDGANFVEVTQASADGILTSVDSPVIAVRADLVSMSGGSAPTVTAIMAAA